MKVAGQAVEALKGAVQAEDTQEEVIQEEDA